jgi:cellulose synthase/poly-beta-1,6-N-acetylglucosamine synthase-like glycosyltransferase
MLRSQPAIAIFRRAVCGTINKFKFFRHQRCLDELFSFAQIDTRYKESCTRLSLSQYILVGILSFLIVVQVVCSLFYIARRTPFVKEEEMQKGILVMVPCYNESDKELRKTVDSVLANDYPDEKRILVVVADGVITGKDETKSCPETLGSLLGFDFDPSDVSYPYNSLGANTTNYASIYSGVYTSDKSPDKKLKYIVIVKQGGPEERLTNRPGNRGKRDSQILLFGILNRLQYGRKRTDLDEKFTATLDSLGLCLHGDIEYLMAIDADTRVSDTSLKFLMHKLEHDKSILACCGETRVDNKMQSLMTMIQVFEYYSAHHLKKAFESVFGCVTCLPGCFTLYRLYTEELEPLLTSDVIVSNYSRNDISSLHERNLYELGEDRMLTTLLLQHFYGMKLSFVPEAICWTIVPHTFQILKSQRRRWINSTVHNMIELLKVQTMCGVCFFSMKMVVIFDLLSTFLLPSGCIYLYYIIIDAAMTSDALSPLAILAFSYIGLMMIPFLMRAQWEYFLWFFFFMIGGIPVFYFFLPVYAFWHMDDLSWGKTRQLKQDPNNQNARDVEMGGEIPPEPTTSSDSSTRNKELLQETCTQEGLVSHKTTSTAITTKKQTRRNVRKKADMVTSQADTMSCSKKNKNRTLTDAADEYSQAASARSVATVTSETKPKSLTKKKKKKNESREVGKELTTTTTATKKKKMKSDRSGKGAEERNDLTTTPTDATAQLEIPKKKEKKKKRKKVVDCHNGDSTEDQESTVDETISVSASESDSMKKLERTKEEGNTKKVVDCRNGDSTEDQESTVDGTVPISAPQSPKRLERTENDAASF